MSTLYYFRPKRFSDDIVGFDWEAPTLVEKFMVENMGKKCFAELVRETGVRTLDQNAALHVLFELIADELNASGQTIQQVLAQTAEISWSERLVKELLWRPFQKALTGKESTTKLDKTTEIDKVYDHLNLFLGEKFGIQVPFPSK